MNSRSYREYSKSVFGGKKIYNFRHTLKRFYDGRISQIVNTPQGLAQISISTNKNGGIIEIEAGLVAGKGADGKYIVTQTAIRSSIYSHYYGQPLDIVDFYYIGESVFPRK